MGLSELVEEYLSSLKSESTKINYKIALVDFLQNIKNIEDITPTAIDAYNKRLQKKKKSIQTIKARFAAIKSFLEYCWMNGALLLNPADKIKVKTAKKYKNAKNIQETDFKKLLKEIKPTLKGLRDSLLIRLIYLYGDMDKVLSLKWEHPMPTLTLTKIKTKLEVAIKKVFTKKMYITGLDPNKLWEKFSRGYLFFSLDKFPFNSDKAISVPAIRKILQHYCVQMGLPENYIDFQALKRLRAKEIYQKTNSIEEVRRFCGHRNSQITKAFLKTLQ